MERSPSYDRGARILRYAINKFGSGGFALARTFYQHLSERATPFENTMESFNQWVKSWQIEAMAETLDVSVEQLLEESIIADLTDDLVPPDAVARYAIPQGAAWDHTPQAANDR